jgi:hypothetical protein
MADDNKKKKISNVQHPSVSVQKGGLHLTASSRGAAFCGAIDHGFALQTSCKISLRDIEQFVFEEQKDKRSGH